MQNRQYGIGLVLTALLAATVTGCAGNSLFRKGAADADGKTPAAAKAEEDRNSVQSANKFLGYKMPGFSERMGKARTSENAGKLDDARDTYQELIREFPDRWEPLHRLALVADRQKRHREAAALYEQAARLKPMDAQILNDMGYCFYLQGQLDKAESALTKAVTLAPTEARFRNNLGLVYGHQNQLDKALEMFRFAGSEADAHYNLAFVLASRDDVEGAKRHFHLALAADPSFEKARDALVSFKRYEQDPHGHRGEVFLADGRRWVPFVETNQTSTADAPGATQTAAAPQSSAAQAAANAGRAQQANFTAPATQ